MCLYAFRVIAQTAGQPEIALVISTTFGSGNNMLDFQNLHRVTLVSQTVPTTIFSSNTDSQTAFFGNLSRGHGWSGGIKPRLTASAKA